MYRIQWANARELTDTETSTAKASNPRAWRDIELALQIDPRRIYIHPPDWGLRRKGDPPAFHGGLFRRQGDRAVGIHRF